MRRSALVGAAALALGASWVAAQDAPESLLPPGFDQPRPPRPRPSPTPSASVAPPPAARTVAAPRPSPTPSPAAAAAPGAAARVAALPPTIFSDTRSVAEGGPLPPLETLEGMTPQQLDAALGLNARFDMPADARRSTDAAGIIDESEGGLPANALAGQDASLVRAAIAGNDGVLVSRWGHILLRRALASRLAPPPGMAAADFAALRVALLARMGEGDAARALAQDIDTGDYTPALTQAALDAYVATADFTGICPALGTQGPARNDPRWQVAGAICGAFSGDAGALASLDRMIYRGAMPKLDLRLAEKYIGAVGRARRAVAIEWDGVDDMTPWRYGLTLATGLQPPDRLMQRVSPWYAEVAATAPMAGLAARAGAADQAGATGVLSSAAMVDLYSQIYADAEVTGDYADAADRLRDAYTAGTLGARVDAIGALWDGGDDPDERYARQVLTAYAAARLPVSGALRDDADDLVTSMLAAGLDANAARWAGVVAPGGIGWAELALASADGAAVDGGALATFVKRSGGAGRRKAALLVAGLAGLGRITPASARSLADQLDVDLAGRTRWTRAIDRAAQVNNPMLVVLLAGLGMQGDEWSRMTPRFLFHIVSALRQTGFAPEARMIAAEAVARG